LLKTSGFSTFLCSRHQFAAGNIFFGAVSRSLIAPFCFYSAGTWRGIADYGWSVLQRRTWGQMFLKPDEQVTDYR